MNSDTTILSQALTWIVGGGGAAVLTYWVMKNVSEWQGAKANRYMSLVLAAVFACLAYSLTVIFGYVATPVGVQGWLESFFAVGFFSVGGSQWLHGKVELD